MHVHIPTCSSKLVAFDGVLLLGAGVYKDSYQLLSRYSSPGDSVAELEFVLKLVH